MQETVKFTDELLKSGNSLELALSKEPIINRINQLLEDHPLYMIKPSDITEINFIASNKPSILQSIDQFGFINKGKTIPSPLHSFIQDINQGQIVPATLNKPHRFFVNFTNREGKLIFHEDKRLKIDIKGPSTNPLIVIQDKENGQVEVKITSNTIGEHEINVRINQQSIQNSPFILKVLNLCDPKSIRDQPILSFGSKGSDDGQFNRPLGICINSKGEIISWLIEIIIEFKFLIKQENSFANLAQKDQQNSQFNFPIGVSVDKQDEIYMLSILRIIAFKFSIQMAQFIFTQLDQKDQVMGSLINPLRFVLILIMAIFL